MIKFALMKQYQIFALISMFFAGLTSVIAKAGLKNVASDTGLAVRTSFVFLIIWLNIFAFKSLKDFENLTTKDIIVLCISGLTTSISWIFYYRAIKIGNVSEVALIDKASIIITLILSFWFLSEPFTWKIGIGAGLILVGLLVLTVL
jgi:bacterial/archaeal transporter family protein